LIGP